MSIFLPVVVSDRGVDSTEDLSNASVSCDNINDIVLTTATSTRAEFVAGVRYSGKCSFSVVGER